MMASAARWSSDLGGSSGVAAVVAEVAVVVVAEAVELLGSGAGLVSVVRH